MATKKVSKTKTILDLEVKTKSHNDRYIPRVNEAYHLDRNAKSILRDVEEMAPVLLTGHTGTGKTSVIMELAARISESEKKGQGVMRLNCNGQLSVADFVGCWTVRSGETVFQEGALIKALREGYWLILDEIDFADPQILSILNAVLENDRQFVLKEKDGELIETHKDFRIFGTANTVGVMADFKYIYQGANSLNAAFLDRWRCYHVNYLSSEQEAEVIANTCGISAKFAEKFVEVANLCRNAFQNEEIESPFSTRRLIDWVKLSIREENPIHGGEIAIFSKISMDDSAVIKGLIERVMISPEN